ncbi:MAG: ribonuclease III domain-containing protein [Clostridia bacterium]|nr:ribonuclease III domain-containing protein [Clostridia bacterium]
MKIFDAKQMNCLNLAFLGDSIFTQFIREFLVKNFDYKLNQLNKMSNKIVCARNQSILLENIVDILTEDEKDIAKRARNIHPGNIAKNSTPEQYSKATQYEAILGFLYLTEQFDRLNEIMNKSIEEYQD